MKKVVLILLFLSGYVLSAQNKAKSPNTPINGTAKKSGSVGKYQASQTQQLVSSQLHDTCLNKQFSLVFYIFLDTIMPGNPGYPGIGMATPSNVTYIVNQLNTVFKPICVSFGNCSTVYIQNYYKGTWKKSITEPIVTGNYYTDKTINIYLVQNDSLDLGYTNTEAEGYTYAPTAANLAAPRKDLIVMEKSQLMQGNGAILFHLMGHYFGLSHTFEEVNSTSTPPALSIELVNGSNCTTNGDGLCDTEADPGPSTPTAADANGDLYYRPIDNYMSYYSQRCRFTQQQYNLMAYTILTKRMYLH